MVEFQVEINGAGEVEKQLGAMFNPEMMKNINKEVAFNAQEQTAAHIAQASVSRHKTAQRLGAKPTGHFEHASGRVMATPPEYDEHGATIKIENTPGILRVFGDVSVKATSAKALTIPIHRIAYGKRVADVKAEGYRIFRAQKNGSDRACLMGEKNGNVVPLYALRKAVTLPKDEGLLPTKEQYADRALDVIDAFVEANFS